MATVITIQKEEHFERLLASDPSMSKRARTIISSVLSKARTSVSKEARAAMESDPRAAYKAVKRMVYKRILGGNISILQRRKATGTRASVTNTPNTGRGGNRCKRSPDTERMMSYYGADRGFVLRFVNNGTAQRTTRYGNRGSINARNWFQGASEAAINQACEQFALLIDNEITNTQV